MRSKKNILICPLEWGLGHAGRMIPLARKLHDMGHNVTIGAGISHMNFFKKELPAFPCIHFPGFRPGYSAIFPQYLVMLIKTPVLIWHIVREHQRLKRIIRNLQIDIVISDNRFGLWNRKITSVYLTHMARIPFPAGFRWLEGIGIAAHRFIIKKYTFCLIPDLPGDLNISGRLSHGVRLPGNTMFSGILSRFSAENDPGDAGTDHRPHNTIILSGPEPQRSILRKKLSMIMKNDVLPSVILEGRPEHSTQPLRDGNIISFPHPPASEMKKLITGSKGIICRSGYTTIMELISLKCSALLIPTPGQTEQEYLAEYLSGKGWFTMTKQKDLNKGLRLPDKHARWTEDIVVQSRELLDRALQAVLKD